MLYFRVPLDIWQCKITFFHERASMVSEISERRNMFDTVLSLIKTRRGRVITLIDIAIGAY
jgi:hypothetical protein